MEKRPVSFATIMGLLKGKRPFGLMGMIFLLISIFVFLPVIVVVKNLATKPYENYDFEAIRSKGSILTANVTAVDEVYNVSVNHRHPITITYTYNKGDKTVSDTFETLDLDKAAHFKPGDDMKIKVYNNESVIEGLKPFSFPFRIFYMFPVMFFSIGLVFFLVGAVPAYKIYRLYKSGIVREATLFSMFVDNGLPVTNFGKRIIVNYYYFDSHSTKRFGTSFTTDFSIMYQMRPDDNIKIFVSEADESQSCIIPQLIAFKNNWKV